MKSTEEKTVCNNVLCLHNKANTGKLEQWNKTCCGMYEIDPYDKKENKTGFKVEDCNARKRYNRYGW